MKWEASFSFTNLNRTRKLVDKVKVLLNPHQVSIYIPMKPGLTAATMSLWYSKKYKLKNTDFKLSLKTELKRKAKV